MESQSKIGAMKSVIKMFYTKFLSEEQNSDRNILEKKYKKSCLTSEQAKEIHQKIRTAFEFDKIYKNNKVGLGELAEHIACNRYKVSETLNKYYSCNFYSLLNSYRIREAKELLLNNPHLSVKTIMYEVGFNSKNSFYTSFKKDTGLSPNEFRMNYAYSSRTTTAELV